MMFWYLDIVDLFKRDWKVFFESFFLLKKETSTVIANAIDSQ